MNLLNETVKQLKEYGKTEQDVLWVGDYTAYFSWEHFKQISNKDYNNGFGGQEVFSHLMIVGNTWWLERHEYDGSEWWEYKELPVKPKAEIKLPSPFRNDMRKLGAEYAWSEDTIKEVMKKIK